MRFRQICFKLFYKSPHLETSSLLFLWVVSILFYVFIFVCFSLVVLLHSLLKYLIGIFSNLSTRISKLQLKTHSRWIIFFAKKKDCTKNVQGHVCVIKWMREYFESFRFYFYTLAVPNSIFCESKIKTLAYWTRRNGIAMKITLQQDKCSSK